MSALLVEAPDVVASLFLGAVVLLIASIANVWLQASPKKSAAEAGEVHKMGDAIRLIAAGAPVLGAAIIVYGTYRQLHVTGIEGLIGSTVCLAVIVFATLIAFRAKTRAHRLGWALVGIIAAAIGVVALWLAK